MSLSRGPMADRIRCPEAHCSGAGAEEVAQEDHPKEPEEVAPLLGLPAREG